MKIAVAQLGARRHYAVPIAFQSKGMLGKFYTDLYLKPGQIHSVLDFASRWVKFSMLGRVKGRSDQQLQADLVRDFPLFAIQTQIATRMANSPGELAAVWTRKGQSFCKKICRDRDIAEHIDGVYCFSSAALELFEWAKPRGIRCVLDHATAPRLFEDRLMREECERFPGWAVPPADDDSIREYAARQRRERELADLIICNSSFAANAIGVEDGSVEKTAVVNLGLDSPVGNGRQHERFGHGLRILFVGTGTINKGIGDLARAVSDYPARQVTTRVVGKLNLTELAKHELSKSLELVGAVPRGSIDDHYEWANLLVLPSVCDTFALVVLEAMAAGVPVVTTEHTGAADIVRDGVDGFIVPIRSPESISRCIDKLIRAPDLLGELSRNARQRAASFSLDCYADRLTRTVASQGDGHC